jgi:signal peptidase I
MHEAQLPSRVPGESQNLWQSILSETGDQKMGNHMNKGTLAQRSHAIFRDWLPSVLLILMLLMARSTMADHYHVPSGSMENSLVPGDHVVVNKVVYGLRIPFTRQVIVPGKNPEAGEVVIFDSPENGVRLIKRVVAVGGDHVSLRQGHLFVNGNAVAVPSSPELEQFGERIVALNLANGGGPDISGMTIPQDHVLVLGDHRGNSHDGRYFGPVPVSEIYGRASAVFWRRGSGPGWQVL